MALAAPRRPLPTSLGASQPLAPPQIQAPNLPPSPTTAPFNFSPLSLAGNGSAGSAMTAPTATPYAAFQAPPPGMSAYGRYRLDKGTQAIARGGAARGTFLSGGLQNRLQQEGQRIASEEEQNDFNRAATVYGLNRDTARGNFSEAMASHTADTGAALDAGRLNLAGATSAYDRNYGAARDAYGDASGVAQQQTGVINANNQAEALFQQQMAQYREALAQQQAAEVAAQDAQTTRMNGMPAPRRGPSLAFGRR